MNISKTKAVIKNSVEKPLGLEWCMAVKNLGVQFSCNQEVVSPQNFQEKLDNSESYKYLEHERFILIWASDNC